MGASVPSPGEEISGRVSIWRIAATPFVMGAALRLLAVVFVQVLHGNFLFLDDQGDDQIGWALAQAWHTGRFPSPQSVAVTNSYLYYLFVAVTYFLLGRHWILIKVLAALLSALSVPAAAAIGNSLGGHRLGIRAAWLAALYPNAIFWGSTGLKDGPMATLLLAVAAIALRPLTMRRLGCAVALLVVAFLSRPVEGAIGLAMLVVPGAELTRMRWNSSGYSVSTGARLLVLFLGIPISLVVLVSQAIRYLPTLQASLAGQSTLSLSTGPVSINFTPSPFDLAYALLSPARWFGPATDSAYIPGMLVWTLLLPAIVLGCWQILRYESRAAKGVLISALVYMYFYSCVFQGQGFSRQRFTVEILFLVMGLYAFERTPRVAATCTALCACLAAPAQLFLSGVLSASGVAIFVIAVSVVWFGAGLLRTRRRRRARRSATGQRALAQTREKLERSEPGADLRSVLGRATSTGIRVVGLRLSSYAVGFLASIMIARAIGPTGRGLYAYPVALLGLVMALAHLGLEFAQVHLAARGKDLRRMWADATVFSLVAGAVCWAAVTGLIALDPRVADGLPLSWIAVPVGLVPLLLMSLYWANLLQLDGRLVMATWASWIGVALQMAATGVLFFTHELTPFRVLMLQWLTNGSTWVLLLAACRRAGLVNLHVDRALIRQSMAFGAKAYIAQIFFYLVLRADQILVAHYAGYRQLGLYALATTVAELLWLLTDPLASALMPHMVRARTGDDRRLSFSTARISLLVLTVAAAAVWFLAPLVIPDVYGAGFAGTVPALRLLLPGVVALGAAKSLGAVRVKEGRMVITSVLGLSAFGLNVALNLVLLPWIGIRGAGIASSACYVALALSYVVIARRRGVAGWRDLVPRYSDLRLLGILRRPASREDAEASAAPLRVALVVGTLNRGGTERQVLMLGSALVERGHTVTVICTGTGGDQAAAARDAGIRVVEANFPGLQRSVLLHPLAEIRRLRAVFRAVAPDVVHCFLYWGYLIGVPIARSIRVRVVISSRRGLTAASRRFRLLIPWERACDRLADAVVCNSIAVMEDAIRHTRLPRRKALVIPNGVFVPAAQAPSGMRPPRVVILANLIAYKGHHVALTAFAQVRSSMPMLEARLQLAGAGPEEGALRAQARELGIDRDVEFLGSVADVSLLLSDCAFTVLPSLTEGMPNAVLESLAHGRAVVASAVGGVPEILRRGGGVLVPPGDPEALANAMRALLADPSMAARLGAEGRAMVHNLFGVERMAQESLRLYRGLLSGKGGSGRLTEGKWDDDRQPVRDLRRHPFRLRGELDVVRRPCR
jgi:glycosyltransferase involved in cell wall biosynthesis/O-antigen/teichoic acid export membrane protein